MKIELAGWECRGLRCPDVKIQIADNATVPQISLVQMPNGTGKTTTLTMLRAAMSGDARHWPPDRVKSYRTPGGDNPSGNFILNLLVDGDLLTFDLKFDFVEGVVKYKTATPGSGGAVQGYNPPPNIRRFLDEKFVRLFVFDGELSDRLLNSSESEAEKAIDALCQIYLLDEISNRAEEVWNHLSKSKTVKTEQGLTKYENIVKKLELNIRRTEKVLTDATKEKDTLLLRISELKNKISSHIGEKSNLNNELEEIKLQEQLAESDVNAKSLQVMNVIRLPHTLCYEFEIALKDLKTNLDKLKLPSSTSSQFFSELLQEDVCICGRALDIETKDVLKKRASLYLGEETSGILNSLKRDIDQFITQEGALTPDSLDDLVGELNLACIRKDELSSMARALYDKILSQGSQELTQWQAELDSKNIRLNDLNELISEIQRSPDPDDDEDSKCLSALKKMLKDNRKKIAEITGTLDVRQKTEIIKNIMDKAKDKARNMIRQSLLAQCNERLDKILYRNPIRIEKISNCLKLEHQDGASMGQTLSVGYTFLTSLLFRGAHQFPLIVDSPAGPLSNEVRAEIGKLIPNLCKQFVGFTISSERAGFITALENECKDQVKYFTMFRRNQGVKTLIDNLPSKGVTDTKFGILVEGREYFVKFDKDTED